MSDCVPFREASTTRRSPGLTMRPRAQGRSPGGGPRESGQSQCFPESPRRSRQRPRRRTQGRGLMGSCVRAPATARRPREARARCSCSAPCTGARGSRSRSCVRLPCDQLYPFHSQIARDLITQWARGLTAWRARSCPQTRRASSSGRQGRGPARSRASPRGRRWAHVTDPPRMWRTRAPPRRPGASASTQFGGARGAR